MITSWIKANFHEPVSRKVTPVVERHCSAIMKNKIRPVTEAAVNSGPPSGPVAACIFSSREWRIESLSASAMLKIKVLAASKKEVFKDLIKAVEFDQTQLSRMVYEEEYGTLGGQPYAALIGDYSFDRSPEDVDMLEKLSTVASAAGAPFIGAALPGLFNLDSFRDIGPPGSCEDFRQ